jgi:hypothetical protein
MPALAADAPGSKYLPGMKRHEGSENEIEDGRARNRRVELVRW